MQAWIDEWDSKLRTPSREDARKQQMNEGVAIDGGNSATGSSPEERTLSLNAVPPNEAPQPNPMPRIPLLLLLTILSISSRFSSLIPATTAEQ